MVVRLRSAAGTPFLVPASGRRSPKPAQVSPSACAVTLGGTTALPPRISLASVPDVRQHRSPDRYVSLLVWYVEMEYQIRHAHPGSAHWTRSRLRAWEPRPSIQSSERPRPATHHPTGPASWRRRTSFARAPSSNATPVAAEASVAILEEALASKDYESRIIAGRRSVRRLGELTPGSRNPLGTRNHDFRMLAVEALGKLGTLPTMEG